MAPTPSKTDSSGPDKNRYGRQIEEAFEAASKLAGSALPPSDFYQQFLNRTLSAIDAPAGAVWLRTPQGFLQIACQVNLEKVGLENRRGGRQCHNEVLRQVFQAAPPRPIMLEPNGRVAANPTAPPDAGAVPAANLTDYFALFAPIVTPDKQSLGVLEVFQDPSLDPRLYPTFLNYAFQMAGYASQYNQFSNARSASGVERTFAQVEAFARLVHTTLNPTEVAYHVANEGRKLAECDRLCVGVRHGRRKVTVEAVSGADVVEKASTHVRRLRKLMEAVLQWGEPLTFKGVKDAGLPPDVSYTLDEYLNESQPKLLVIQPIRDEREKDTKKPARSVLVMESFNPPEQTEPLIQRLEVVGKHAAPALYNAAEMKRVPLKFLWWPIAKVQDGLGGKGRFYAAGIAVLLALITATMVFVPAPLRMEAKGKLQPVDLLKVYPPREGILRELTALPKSTLLPGATVAKFQSAELEKEQIDLLNKLHQASAEEGGALRGLQDLHITAIERAQLETKRAAARDMQLFTYTQLQVLNQQYNAIPNQWGWYLAKTGAFTQQRALPADKKEKWTVLNENRQEALIGRTLRTSEEVIRLGYLEGDWHVELKIPQRNVGQIMRAFTTPGQYKREGGDTGRKYLDVDVLLSSMPDDSYRGRLYLDDLSAEAVPNKDEHDENEPVVTAYVKLNQDDIPPELRAPREQYVTGLEVRTRVRCGDHALGYTLFHGVWEWFYEKVVFFF